MKACTQNQSIMHDIYPCQNKKASYKLYWMVLLRICIVCKYACLYVYVCVYVFIKNDKDLSDRNSPTLLLLLLCKCGLHSLSLSSHSIIHSFSLSTVSLACFSLSSFACVCVVQFVTYTVYTVRSVLCGGVRVCVRMNGAEDAEAWVFSPGVCFWGAGWGWASLTAAVFMVRGNWGRSVCGGGEVNQFWGFFWGRRDWVWVRGLGGKG